MSTPTVEELRAIVRAAGFTWSDADLEAMRPAAARALEMLAALETAPVGAVEPATQYRIV